MNTRIENLNNLTEEIKKVTDDYDVNDLALSVFCINICVDNRSFIDQAIALNASIIKNNHTGKKSIKSYEEFKAFVETIRPILTISNHADDIVKDFGEVRLDFYNKFHPVIVGTGHNEVFAYLHYLPILAHYLGKGEDLQLLLNYHTTIIEFFKNCNLSKAEYPSGELTIPTEELFNKTIEFFSSEIPKWNLEHLYKLYDNDLFEHAHFVKIEDSFIPLYNVSMLVDICNEWIAKMDAQKKTLITGETILTLLLKLYHFDLNSNPRLLVPVELSNNDKTIHYDPDATNFILVAKERLLIGINGTGLSESTLLKIIKEIKEAHENNQLIIKEKRRRTNENKCIGISVPNKTSITILVYDNILDIDSYQFSAKENNSNSFYRCTTNDLIYYLCYSDDVDDLLNYISFRRTLQKKMLFKFGGDAGVFLTWKDMKGALEQETETTDILTIDPQEDTSYVVDYYNKLQDFSWEYSSLLCLPFCWTFDFSSNNMMTPCISKNVDFFGGCIKSFREQTSFIISVTSRSFFNDGKDMQELQAFEIVNELNEKLINDFSDVFDSYNDFCGNGIELLFQPWNYARKLGYTNSKSEKAEWIASDGLYDSNVLTIRYSVKKMELVKALQEANDRAAEVYYFICLLAPIKDVFPDLYNRIQEKASMLRDDKKTVILSKIPIEYTFNEDYVLSIPDHDYIKARKIIADICSRNGIESGTYYGKDANDIIRTIEDDLVSTFTHSIIQYDMISIHIELLRKLAILMHNYYVDKAKYKDLFELNQEDRMSAEKSIIDKRTDTLHEITYTLYFIESNLLYERKNKEPCDMNAFLELSAYAHWVALLLEDANILYRTSDLVHIVVNDDLTIDSETINNPEYAAYNKRTYDYQGYGIGDKDADNLFIGKVVSTLEAELNIDFQTFIDFMNYLQVYAAKKSVPLEKNVYQIKINDLLQDFMQKVSFEASYEGVVSCLKVLSINTKDLLIKGKNGSSFLPIGRRKDRANRFEIKPLLIVGDSIIYSPVHINYVHKRWVDGLLDWYPPYEKGISNTVKVLDEWKRHYESKMVLDLKKVFDDCKYNYVMTNYTVKNPNIYGDYPTDIGDYDVIAINNTKHEVWIIECKVIKKVGSFNEMYDQQNNFFKNKRYVEKFELRIDFMKKNYKTLLANKCDRNYEYTVVSKMCINKVFSSQFKQIGIDIVSFDELVKSIKQEK